MKRILSFAIAACIIFSASGVFAASGSAIVPVFRYQTKTSPELNVSPWLFLNNITANPIDVTVTYYESDGTIVSDGDDSLTTGKIRGVNVTSFDDNPTGASATFTIDANEQGIVYLVGTTSDKAGWAVVEWTQDSDAVVGLVAHEIIYTSTPGTGAHHSISVNGNLPF